MRCPKCASRAPQRHPAVQHGGEVELCAHDYHRQVTPENTVEKIRNVEAMLAAERARKEQP